MLKSSKVQLVGQDLTLTHKKYPINYFGHAKFKLKTKVYLQPYPIYYYLSRGIIAQYQKVKYLDIFL